jgi:hypothetical protein
VEVRFRSRLTGTNGVRKFLAYLRLIDKGIPMKIIHGDITLESGKTMSAQEVDQLADELATNDYEWTSLDSFPAEAQCSRTRLQSFIYYLTFQSIRKQKKA